MDLYSLFATAEAGAVGATIRESTWLFPVIEALHLLALALLGGAVLMLDLRLLGVGLSGQATSSVERDARPWFIAAVTTLIGSGVLIGLSEALKLYDKPAFWVKMVTLATALLFLVRPMFEERYLIDQFPDDYSMYKGSTKMLVPFIF